MGKQEVLALTHASLPLIQHVKLSPKLQQMAESAAAMVEADAITPP
jgi:hypothetical protein